MRKPLLSIKKIIAIILFFIPIYTSGQFYAGLRLGVNSSNQFYTYKVNQTSYPYTYNYSYNSRYGSSNSASTKIETIGEAILNFNYGISAGYFFRRFISLQTELTYMQTGFSFKDNTSTKIQADYIQWNPIMIRMLTGNVKSVQFFVSTGLAFGFLLSSQLTIPDAINAPDPNDPLRVGSISKVDIKDYVNAADGSLILGTGLSIPLGRGKLEFEGRYQGGFSGVYKEDIFGLNQTIHNSNWIFQTSYLLFLSRL